MTDRSYPESDLQSSTTAPEVSLDIMTQANDIAILKSLKYLQLKPQQPLKQIVSNIIADPMDSAQHQNLEQYLFNRYQATIDELKQKIIKLNTQHQNILTSQHDQCPNCQQYLKTIEQLQEQASQPCISCIQLKDAINKIVQSVQGVDQTVISRQAILNDLQHVFTNTFQLPSNYFPLDQEKQKLQEAVAAQMQKCEQSLQNIKTIAQEYLGGIAQANQIPQVQPQDICEQTEIEIVNALNRATTLLTEKDSKIAQLTAQLNNIQIIQPSQLQGSVPAQQSLYGQQQPAQTPLPPEGNQLFYELLAQELFQLQTPSDENQFMTQKFTKAAVVRKSIADLLRETLQMLSKTFGRNDLLIEQQLQPPVQYIRDQLDQHQQNILDEVQRLGSLALTVRYCIRSCLDAGDGQQEQPQISPHQQQYIQLQTQVQKSLASSLKSLFSMALWPDHQNVKKSFGLMQSNELAQQVINNCTNIPENFMDKQMIIDLSDLFLGLPKTELGTTLERLQNMLFELQTRCRIVPSNIADLASVAIDLEEQNKEQQQKLDEHKQENSTLKEIIKQGEQEKKEMLKDLTRKDNELNKQVQQIKDMQGDLQKLQLENSRIPGLQEQIKSNLAKIEEVTFRNSELEQTNRNQGATIERQTAAIGRQTEQIADQKDLIEKQQVRLNQFELQQQELVAARQDVVNKNRELVQLAKSMEERLGEQEREIIKCKQVIGQEMPLLQQNLTQVRKLNTDLQNQLDDCTQERRKLFVQTKDQGAQLAQQEGLIKQLQQQFSEANSQYMEATTQNKQIEQEVNHLTKLFLDEQEKSRILGDNLDKVSERNSALEQQRVEQTAQLEKAKYDNNQNEILLQECQIELNNNKQKISELTDQNMRLTATINQNNEETVKNAAQNQLLKTQLEKLESQYQDLQQTTNNEIAIKQRLINELTTQMSQLTFTANNNEGTIGGLIKTQYNQEMQKYLDMQQEQFNAQIAKMDEDNTLLINELTNAKSTNKQLQKENKQLTRDNSTYKEQIAQFTTMQDKLVQKSQKLLKTTNLLKQKSLILIRDMERLSTYAGNKVQYYSTIQQVLDTQAAGQVGDTQMTLTSLNQTNATQNQEVHSAEVLRMPNPTEEQMKTLCDLIATGLDGDKKDKRIGEMKRQAQELSEQNAQLNEKVQRLSLQLHDEYQRYKELSEKHNEQGKTIQMLTQNLNMSRELLQQHTAEADIEKIQEKIKSSLGKQRSDSNLSIDDIEKSIGQKANAMKSSNLASGKQVQFAPNQLNTLQAQPQSIQSVFADSSAGYKVPARYQHNVQDGGKGASYYGRITDYTPLTAEEQMNIQRILKQNQANLQGTDPETVGVLPGSVFVEKK